MTNLEWTEYGETRKLGVMHTHGDVSIEYYCSEDLRERQFFEQWQDLIFNPKSKKHAYYKDYISRIEIAKYNSDWSKKTVVYRLNEAYPTSIAAQEMNSDAGDLLKLSITFKYRNYEISGPGLFDGITDAIQGAINGVTDKLKIF